jgi:hypothetical protein
MSFFKQHAPNHREHNRTLPDLSQYEGMKAQREESALPSAKWEQENRRIKELGLDPEKVNVNGGAIAIGHPLGASAPRVIFDLCRELRRRGGGYGIAAACIGVGQGQAVVVHVG